MVAAAIQALAIPFVILARRENAVSDPITAESVGSKVDDRVA